MKTDDVSKLEWFSYCAALFIVAAVAVITSASGRSLTAQTISTIRDCAVVSKTDSDTQTYQELPNFHQVNERLYRAAQPRPGGLRLLVRLGINTIVNLRDTDARTRAEEAEAKALGLRYYNVPMPGFSRPTEEQVGRVLALINDPLNGKVFVHCNHGADRTGTVIACYRISHDGWASACARREAKRYGMSWLQIGMRDFIGDYHKRSLSAVGSDP
ncbi:MAG: fused DSP-PTPase phosphatase/NAD kinase-like protein [Pyrinomonadaceae bacterium]